MTHILLSPKGILKLKRHCISIGKLFILLFVIKNFVFSQNYLSYDLLDVNTILCKKIEG